jgi:purine catabolism regulator
VKVRDIPTLHQNFDRIWTMCGEAGLDNEVRGIDALETSYSPYWSSPNDFIVTTGYCMSNGDTTVENWINIFLQRGVAGLGIKLGLFLDELPPDASVLANKNKFPVLFIPPDLKYEDILRPMLARLLEEEQSGLAALDGFKVALGHLSGSGYTLDTVIKLLQKYIECPIELLWSSNFDPIAPHNILNAHNVKNFLRKNIQKLHPQETYSVLTANTGKYSVFKINSAFKTMAFLAVTHKGEQPLSRAQIAMIQETLPLLAICLLSKSAPAVSSSPQSKEKFFSDILDGLYESREHEIKEDAAHLKIDFLGDRVLWIMEFVEKNWEHHDRYLKTAAEYLENCGESFIHVNRGTSLYKNRPVFISDSPTVRDAQRLQDLLCGLRSHIRKSHKNVQCDIGVSETAGSLLQLGASYDEAKFSLEMGKKLAGKSHVYFYKSYRIYHLLSETWEMPTLSSLYKNTLGRLALHDLENESDFSNLLLVLTDCGFNVSSAANELGVNRKTLKKHVALIGDIVRLDMDNLENQIVLNLMSRMKKILDSTITN